MKHHSDFASFGGILGALQSGRFVRSDVDPPDDSLPWNGRPVYLNSADVYCDDCRDLIHADDWYGEAWTNVLARQKLKYSGTWCGECFTERSDPTEAENESSRPGRQFD